MTDRLEQAVEEQKRQNQQEAFQISGLLGIPLGGQRRVEVPNRNAYVFVRLRSNQNEVIQAYNNQVATSYNLPVIVERHGNKYIVAGVDTARYENNWKSQAPFLPRHGNTHSFDLESGGGGDVVWVQSRQIVPMLVFPSGSVGAENVIVHPYTLRNDDGTWRYVGNTGTASLAPYRPVSPTGAVMSLVYLDSDTGNPQLLINSGSVFSNAITGSSQIIPYIPSLTNPAKDIPLAAIRLITGTNQISWDNIYDLRQWLHTIPTGSTGGGAAAGIQGIPVQDEGVFVATGSVLNFVGDNVSATVSGSVIRVYVTGSASGGSINTGTLDARYLKLDGSNDPVTNSIEIQNNDENFEGDTLVLRNRASSPSYGALFAQSVSGSFGAWFQVENNTILFLDQTQRGSQELTNAAVSISRYPSDALTRGARASAISITDASSGTNHYGPSLRHRIGSNDAFLTLHPYATGTVPNYIFDALNARPTGTVHTSFRVHGDEVARVDVSGTVFSNNVPLVKEAPVDGQVYGRKNAGWQIVSGSAGGLPNPFALPADITPPMLGANVDDYEPAGGSTADVWRLEASGSNREIQGIAGGSDGRILVLHNIGATYNITLRHEFASTAANRVQGPHTIPPRSMAVLQYDSTSSRWRTLGGDARSLYGVPISENLPTTVDDNDVLQYSSSEWQARSIFLDSEGDPSTVGTTSTDGTSNFAARRDHVHAGIEEVYYAAWRTGTVSAANGTSALVLNAESADSHGYYNPSNGRFTPLHSGTYFFDGVAEIDDLKDGGSFWIGVRKTGGQIYWANAQLIGGAGDAGASLAVSVYLNGSTDYTEIVVFHDHGSARNIFGLLGVTRAACRRTSPNNIVGY